MASASASAFDDSAAGSSVGDGSSAAFGGGSVDLGSITSPVPPSGNAASTPASTTPRSSSQSGDDNAEPAPPARTKRPADVALKQQRMKAWQPLLDPKWVIPCYLLIGVIFIPIGIVVRRASDALIELKAVYESHLEDGTPADVSGCEIGDNPNKMWIDGGQTLDATGNTCTITMQVPLDKGDMDPPVLVHYELQNFYQNYRKYITSYDQYQLLGQLAQDQYEVQRTKCDPLAKIGDTYINPCGLVANTLFNDVIELVSVAGPDGTPLDAPLVETGIAWASDLEYKYRQPDGFRSAPCPSCDDCDCNEVDDATGERTWSCDAPYEDVDGVCHRYYYPFDDETQYLYETYPMMINPLEGVTNEHFVVWMRAAALPHFRKLYGYIEVPIPAGSTLTFRIMANFAVERLKGSKALVVGNTYAFGGKNHWLGTLFVTVGSIAAILGLFFLAKDRLAPRKLGDKMYLKYKGD